jgi:hypothetical protein
MDMNSRYTAIVLALCIFMMFGMFYVGYTMGNEHGIKDGIDIGYDNGYINATSDFESMLFDPAYLNIIDASGAIKIVDADGVEYKIFDQHTDTKNVLKEVWVLSPRIDETTNKKIYVYYDFSRVKDYFDVRKHQLLK